MRHYIHLFSISYGDDYSLRKFRLMFPLEKSAYEILKQIGKGATAEVYVAKCKKNNKLIAMKMIDLEACPIEIESLHHEVAFWSSSQSPNVVQYYGSFVEGPVLYIVMEYMSAGSCYEIMRFSSPKGIEKEIVIASILHEVLMALTYFHENRQIHRDVKAGNILINEEGLVKMGDFGIAANLLEKGQRKRARFTVIGTPCYMAPEVLKEEEGYTEKADIWSLGITAIELALGAAPYSNLFPLEVIVKIVNQPPPSLPDEPRFSAAFKDFVKQCLIPVPAKRPTAKQLLDHRFLKQVKNIKETIHGFVESLPPLAQRFAVVHTSANQPKPEPAPQKQWEFDFGDAEPQPQPIKEAPQPAKITATAAPVTGQTVTRHGKFTITKSEKKESLDGKPQAAMVGVRAHTQPPAQPQPQVQPQLQPQIQPQRQVTQTPSPPPRDDQITALEVEVAKLKERAAAVATVNASLKVQLDELTTQVRQLMKQQQ